MADDRKRRDDQSGSDDVNEQRVRGGVGDEVRSVADEGEEELEDTEDLDEDEDSDGSF